jgi:hypothetical protein
LIDQVEHASTIDGDTAADRQLLAVCQQLFQAID